MRYGESQPVVKIDVVDLGVKLWEGTVTDNLIEYYRKEIGKHLS